MDAGKRNRGQIGLPKYETRVLPTLSVPNPGAWNARPSLVLHRTHLQGRRNQLLTLFRSTQQAPDPFEGRVIADRSRPKLASLIPIGYPAESPEKSKRPPSDALRREKYRSLRKQIDFGGIGYAKPRCRNPSLAI